MKVCCLTCTGDRPLALSRAKYYIQRSRYPVEGTVEWVVVDDGITPYNPGECTYLRRSPDGPNSLGRNLLYGLIYIANSLLIPDYVIIHEDDDWYHPDRIVTQVDKLHAC